MHPHIQSAREGACRCHDQLVRTLNNVPLHGACCCMQITDTKHLALDIMCYCGILSSV